MEGDERENIGMYKPFPDLKLPGKCLYEIPSRRLPTPGKEATHNFDAQSIVNVPSGSKLLDGHFFGPFGERPSAYIPEFSSTHLSIRIDFDPIHRDHLRIELTQRLCLAKSRLK